MVFTAGLQEILRLRRAAAQNDIVVRENTPLGVRKHTLGPKVKSDNIQYNRR